MDDSRIESLSNDELRDLLVQHGLQVVGPVVKTTRKVYENKLKKLLSSGGGSARTRGTPSTTQSSPMTPANDRLSSMFNTTTSSGGSVFGASPVARSTGSRGRNTYGDTISSNDADDDLMMGEESFRYVGPVNDSDHSASPYSAMGGSLIKTPSPARPSTKPQTSTPSRLDYNYQDTYSPPAKSYGFSSRAADGLGSKTSTISYHTSGGGSEAYRRSTTYQPPQAVAPRTAEPRIPYSALDDQTTKGWFGWDTARALKTKARRWAPWLAKILGAIFLIIFIYMVVKRAMRSGMGEEEDESFQLPP